VGKGNRHFPKVIQNALDSKSWSKFVRVEFWETHISEKEGYVNNENWG